MTKVLFDARQFSTEQRAKQWMRTMQGMPSFKQFEFVMEANKDLFNESGWTVKIFITK